MRRNSSKGVDSAAQSPGTEETLERLNTDTSLTPRSRKGSLLWMKSKMKKGKANSDMKLSTKDATDRTNLGNQSGTSKGTLGFNKLSFKKSKMSSAAASTSKSNSSTLRKKKNTSKKNKTKGQMQLSLFRLKRSNTKKGSNEFITINFDDMCVVPRNDPDGEQAKLAAMQSDLSTSHELRGILSSLQDGSTDLTQMQEMYKRGLLQERDSIRLLKDLEDHWTGQKIGSDDDEELLSDDEEEIDLEDELVDDLPPQVKKDL